MRTIAECYGNDTKEILLKGIRRIFGAPMGVDWVSNARAQLEDLSLLDGHVLADEQAELHQLAQLVAQVPVVRHQTLPVGQLLHHFRLRKEGREQLSHAKRQEESATCTT